MRLGWVLEEVTVTRLWLVFNDNKRLIKTTTCSFDRNAANIPEASEEDLWGNRLRQTFREAQRYQVGAEKAWRRILSRGSAPASPKDHMSLLLRLEM